MALGKAPMQPLLAKLVTELAPLEAVKAIEKIHEVHGHRQCCKALTYFKSAMTWASKRTASVYTARRRGGWPSSVQTPPRMKSWQCAIARRSWRQRKPNSKSITSAPSSSNMNSTPA
ncbi:hypothetical protein ACVW1A_005001 [Bradyrhizobium sp. LB1.3]